MIDAETLDMLVASAYAAAIEDDGWDGWLRDLCGALGSGGGLFGVIDRRSGQLEHMVPLCDNPRGWEEYVAGMGRHDPHARQASTVTQAVLQTGADFIDPLDPIVQDYRAWEEDRFGFHSSVLLAGAMDADRTAGFCLHFRRDRAEWAGHSRAVLASGGRNHAILQAMQLGVRHRHLLREHYWQGIAARSDGRATWLLGERGQVLRHNDAAEAMLLRGDGITMQQGLLLCRSAGAALRQCIRAAVEIGEGGVVALPREGRRPLVATLYPLPRSRRSLVADEAAALLTIDDPARVAPAAFAAWQSLFELTATEARVADAMRAGEGDESVAARLGVRVSTIRTHLKSIHAKTETRSKAELVALLARCTVG